MSKNWPTVRFSAFLRPNSRPHRLGPEEDANLVGMRLYGEGPFHRELKPAMQIAKKSHFAIRAGDVIYNKLFAWKGTFGVVPQELDGMFVSDKFPTYELDRSLVDVGFLRWYFRCPPLWEEAKRMSTGSAALSKLTLNPPKFLLLTMPLPDLEEQRRCVVLIEQLAAQVREARSFRHQARAETKLLVPRFIAAVFDKLSCATKSLGEVAEKRTGVAYKATDFSDSEGVPVVRLKEIGSKSPTVFLRNPEDYSNVWLENGDIVLAKTSFSTGAMCQWEGPPAVLNQNAVMLRAKDGLNQQFLFAWLRQQVDRYLSSHLTDPNYYPYIRESELIRWQVPLPSLTEQRRIVAELDLLQEQVDALKRLQAESATKLDALLPSILDRAFKGEL